MRRSLLGLLCPCELVGDAVQRAGNCCAGVCSCRALTTESSISMAQRLLAGAPPKREMKCGLSLIFTFAITLFLLYFSVISVVAEP